MIQKQIEMIILTDVLGLRSPERVGPRTSELARNAAQKIIELIAAAEPDESFETALARYKGAAVTLEASQKHLAEAKEMARRYLAEVRAANPPC
jgi:hypothetical protein